MAAVENVLRGEMKKKDHLNDLDIDGRVIREES
jgi:hypothetical protein